MEGDSPLPFLVISIKRPPLVNNEIYHVVLRGVGDSLIFKDDNDHYRGIFSLYEFNTTNPIEIRKQRERRQKMKDSGGLTSADARDLLVEILVFYFMPNHIHCNGVSLIQPRWKEKGIKNLGEVINFLENYKWSSYPDYIGKKNFPSLTNREFLLELIGEINGCREFMDNWLKYKGKVKDKFNNLLLE